MKLFVLTTFCRLKGIFSINVDILQEGGGGFATIFLNNFVRVWKGWNKKYLSEQPENK